MSSLEPPSKLAVLGAGPIGLELALYARFLGYDVQVYERGRVAENVRQWGHVQLFTPFGMNCSPLGLAALEAQQTQRAAPDALAVVTGQQWVDEYLQPLAESDLLAGSICLETTVVSVGRPQLWKQDYPCAERADSDFRLLLEDADGRQRDETAEAVIDTTGVFGNPNYLGAGGVPAIGEAQCRDQVHYGLPDFLGKDRDQFAGRRVLLVGAGYSAATSVVALAELAATAPGTQVTWITRRGAADGPIRRIEEDPLPHRDQLALAANALATDSQTGVVYLGGTVVQSIHRSQAASAFRIDCAGRHAGTIEMDRVVANVGYRPHRELYRELQIHECYVTEGLMNIAAQLLSADAQDCLAQPACDAAALKSPEPDFYCLGAKSYGRNSRFLYQHGLAQIRNLFTIIGDRHDLDLYRTIRPAACP